MIRCGFIEANLTRNQIIWVMKFRGESINWFRCYKVYIVLGVNYIRLLQRYRIRQRGCSLTHSARTPPARDRNNFLGRGFFGGQEIFLIFFGFGIFLGRRIFLGAGDFFGGGGFFKSNISFSLFAFKSSPCLKRIPNRCVCLNGQVY